MLKEKGQNCNHFEGELNDIERILSHFVTIFIQFTQHNMKIDMMLL